MIAWREGKETSLFLFLLGSSSTEFDGRLEISYVSGSFLLEGAGFTNLWVGSCRFRPGFFLYTVVSINNSKTFSYFFPILLK